MYRKVLINITQIKGMYMIIFTYFITYVYVIIGNTMKNQYALNVFY